MPATRIFVFGSNLSGIHGAGAAAHAKKYHGAQDGVGEGPTGTAYAIPTKDERIRTLDLARIEIAVLNFLAYAAQFPNTEFEVTRIGCGYAGYQDHQIAPFFRDAPANCKLPHGWRDEY